MKEKFIVGVEKKGIVMDIYIGEIEVKIQQVN